MFRKETHTRRPIFSNCRKCDYKLTSKHKKYDKFIYTIDFDLTKSICTIITGNQTTLKSRFIFPS